MQSRGKRVDVPSGEANLTAELFLPAGRGPHPGVLVLHESFGLNNDIRRLSTRFADAGYVALAPDLYSHGRRLVCLSRVLVDMTSGRIEREVADILAARAALAAREDVDAERIAVAGFCQGGGFALVAGARGDFAAAAVNYGMVPAERPRLDGLCPVVASYGAKDKVVGGKVAQRLESHLAALGVPRDIKTYEHAGHSFFSRYEGWQGWIARLPSPLAAGYEERAAEDAWRRMLDFFAEHVVGTSA
jgi:carboxymethylenebutenolidase